MLETRVAQFERERERLACSYTTTMYDVQSQFAVINDHWKTENYFLCQLTVSIAENGFSKMFSTFGSDCYASRSLYHTGFWGNGDTYCCNVM
jgi:hypothetical protein